MSKWVKFELIEEKPKTKIWAVISIKDADEIGEIKWNNGWRRYTFYPEEDYETYFDAECLRDIATFIEEATKSHRAGK